jgi:hypothetical protein
MATPLCTLGVTLEPPEDPFMAICRPDESYTPADAVDRPPLAMIG